jgi:hypothetical protein
LTLVWIGWDVYLGILLRTCLEDYRAAAKVAKAMAQHLNVQHADLEKGQVHKESRATKG